LEIEHIKPYALGGTDDERHFKWSDDGTEIIGLTASGRATVVALKLNNTFAIEARSNWVSAGWHPPKY
jgi:hypothetical protein